MGDVSSGTTRGGKPADPLTVEIASRIRSRREDLSMSLADAADAMGITKDYLWRVEGARQSLTVVALGKIVGGLDTTLSELLDGLGPHSRGGVR